MNAAPWLSAFAERAALVERALEYSGGTHDVADVAAAIENGLFQMWCGPHSIVVTEIIEYPKMRDCHVFLAGGMLDEVEQIAPHVEEWARKQNCQRVTIAGRKGWERTFLRGRGYMPRWYVMSKELGI